MAMKRTALILVALMLSTGVLRPAPARADPMADAKAAIEKHDYPTALAALRPVLTGGVAGDRTAAKDLLVKMATDGADDSVKGGQDEVAVQVLVDVADLIEPDPRATALEARAKDVLHNLYVSATRAKAYDRALWAVTTSASDFPADPPLAPQGSIESLRVGAAAIAIRTASPEHANAIVAGLIAAKIPVSAIDLGGVDRAAVAVGYAKWLEDSGWYAQAAAVAGDAIAVGQLPPAGEQSVSAARSSALAARADACLAFGNRAMAAAAVGDFTVTAGPADAATTDRLKTALAKLNESPASDAPPAANSGPAPVSPSKPKPGYVPFQDAPNAPGKPTGPPAATAGGPVPVTPIPLTLAEPALGNQEWVDSGSGYTLGGKTVRIGNCKAEHGGDWAKGDLHIRPGYVLEDGVLNPSSGVLHFEGTADRPVIVRRVRINCDYTATVEAKFTLFQDCTFHKSGSWHWNNGANTKWTLGDCMLVGCHFDKGNAVDYGLILDRCALVATTFPPRVWKGHDKNSADGDKAYRSPWSHVVDCDFHDCTLAVSAVWMGVNCNFVGCHVSDPAPFPCQKPLSVELGVSDDDQPFYDAVVGGTTAGADQITYARHEKPYRREGGPSPLWHFAPADRPSVP